jgi:hypothetical protein
MQNLVRIPSLPSKSYFAMNRWFQQMQQAGLLYHPDERAENIVDIKTGTPMFDSHECEVLDTLMEQMFDEHGDKVYDVCLKLAHKVVDTEPPVHIV